jgi:hypothetical protein
MISEDNVTRWILAALEEVKSTNSSVEETEFTEETILVGPRSPLDSIAFSYFASALDETIEDETGEEYMLQLDDLYELNGGKGSLQVRDVARLVAVQMGQSAGKLNGPH